MNSNGKLKIYFDQNCISYIRTPEDYSINPDIKEFTRIFNKTFLKNISTYCSTAHFMDLFNANGKFLKKDLEFLDILSNHNFLYFDKSFNSIELISPISISDAFIAHDNYKEHPELLLYFTSDNLLLNKFFLKRIAEFSKNSTEHNLDEINKELKKHKIFPLSDITEAIISDKSIPPHSTDNNKLYKVVREFVIQYSMKHQPIVGNLQNLSKKQIVDNAEVKLKEFLNRAPFLLELLDICNEFDKYKLLFFLLNLLKLDNEKNGNAQYKSLIADATHCYFARFSDYFLTNDVGCNIKAQVVYRILGHNSTQVIDIKQAVKLFSTKSKKS